MKPMKPVLNLEKDVALLLTASIDIKGMPRATPLDPKEREADYFNTLKYYMTHHPKVRKIVFVENSGWSLDRVKEVMKENPHKKEVEFVSLNCNNFPRNFGKGYGEAFLLNQGMEKSDLIQSVSHIAKITGRIRLVNMTRILEEVREYYDFLCDFKDQGWLYQRYIARNSTARPHCDTRFFVANRELYKKYLENLVANHKEGGFSIEEKYYGILKKVASTEKVVVRLPLGPDFRGIAGHFQGKNYESTQERAKWRVRSLARKVTPWLHI